MHFARFTILLIFTILMVGCASQTSEVQTAVYVPVPTDNQGQSAETPAVSELPRQLADIVPFANRIEWPQMPESVETSAFNMDSGADDHVWVEGKGYFKGTLDEIYADFIDPLVIGPIHMTKDIVRDQFVETGNKTSYVMHVKMKYIMTIEFDLSVTIEKIYDGDQYVGLMYTSQKIAGTRFIEKISDTILVKKVDDSRFSVEFSSINVATMDKEKEAREHLEVLFEYWKNRTNQTNQTP